MAQDWRSRDHYAHLAHADRLILGWEWLRRNPDYRRAADGRIAGAVRADPAYFGLHRFIDPSLGAPHARPMWRAGFSPLVLRAVAFPSQEDQDSFELEQVAPLMTLERFSADRQHLLLSDGLAAIRLDVAGAMLGDGPVKLAYEVAGVRSARMMIDVISRFLGVAGAGVFPRPGRDLAAGNRRRILELRAHDALMQGASQREIASVLLDSDVALDQWRLRCPSVRLQVQRLVRRARSMADDGYRRLCLNRQPTR